MRHCRAESGMKRFPRTGNPDITRFLVLMEWPEQGKSLAPECHIALLSRLAVRFLHWQNGQQHNQNLKREGWQQVNT